MKNYKKRLELAEKEIDDLREQLKSDLTHKTSYMFGVPYYESDELTLSGKVNLILEHLGLEPTVVQAREIPATPKLVRVKKVKKGKK